MLNVVTLKRAMLVGLALALGACATHDASAKQKWAAHGYLTPGANGEPEIIGAFDTESECRAAVDYWMSRQVVGNPVSGECLPIDSH